MNTFRLGSVLSAIALVLSFGLTDFDLAAGKGGGGKPPPDKPPVTDMKQEIVTVQDAGKQQQQIVVMNADGTDAQVVLVGERHARFRDVSWSGDGSKVLFWGEVNGQAGIHWVQVFELDGDGERVKFDPGPPEFVTTTIYAIPHARWSPKPAPDGREWIAYWDTTEPTWQMWLVDPDPPHEKFSLSSVNGRHEYQPSWSPDAGRIAFLSVPAEDPCSCPGDVEILELGVDGSNKIAVTDRISLIVDNPNVTQELKDQLTAFAFWGTDWANNAEWIVTGIPFSTLWVFPTDPSEVWSKTKEITNDPELAYHTPVWSPGDDALLFTREGYGGVCDVPDNNDQPPLQGGPSSRVIAPLVFSPPDEIDYLDICDDVTFPFDLVRYDYEWWRGGEGMWR